MEWKGRRQSDNIEDRTNISPGGGSRGSNPFGGPGFRIPGGGGGRGRGGLSMGTIVLLVGAYFVLKMMGIDMLQLLGEGGGNPSGYEQTQQQGQRPSAPSTDDTKAFVRVILAETEDVWNGIFQSAGERYQEPTLVLFAGSTSSACGLASSASGPFYCPGDRKVYLDTAFFDELATRFNAAGDFAQAYVIAHEVGHHVQNLTGILPEFNRRRQSMDQAEANRMSVRVELQADCYAGIWAKFTDQKGLLDSTDIKEALNAARQIGDDTLQKRSQGYVVPDSFNHGTSEQRMTWFQRGFESGRVADCNTFSGPV